MTELTGNERRAISQDTSFDTASPYPLGPLPSTQKRDADIADFFDSTAFFTEEYGNAEILTGNGNGWQRDPPVIDFGDISSTNGPSNANGVEQYS
jgi:hypothetical protein